jgi:ergothioneine biosynthesis protein EgtB
MVTRVEERPSDGLAAPSPTADARALAERYQQVRRFTEQLCTTLEPEDYVVQSMPDVSPAKWHLAHVSWFFETFLLRPESRDYRSPDDRYNFLFNSYYEAVGPRHERPRRGLLSRPTVKEVYRYRAHVDEHVLDLLETADDATAARVAPVVTLGLHHEQQHQELLLTDLKHVFSCNPLKPAFAAHTGQPGGAVPPLRWHAYPEGVYWIGHTGDDFAFDNETPRHRVFLDAFRLGSRPVTSGEYLQFMADGGYTRPDLWLSMGWATVQEQGWRAPFHWEERDGRWLQFTLTGLREVDPAEPVCHVSYFEADAYARWAGARLPTEAEWEVAAADVPIRGNFVEDGRWHPAPAATDAPADHPSQLYGDVWEWTQSAYDAYPGFRPVTGAIGEYNGKFMCGQYVLRGGSCATSVAHIRPTYRNFFPPDARWQFTGIRLAAAA